MFLHITFYSLARTRHLVGADVCDPDLPSFTSLFFRIYFEKSINLPLIIQESNTSCSSPCLLFLTGKVILSIQGQEFSHELLVPGEIYLKDKGENK